MSLSATPGPNTSISQTLQLVFLRLALFRRKTALRRSNSSSFEPPPMASLPSNDHRTTATAADITMVPSSDSSDVINGHSPTGRPAGASPFEFQHRSSSVHALVPSSSDTVHHQRLLQRHGRFARNHEQQHICSRRCKSFSLWYHQWRSSSEKTSHRWSKDWQANFQCWSTIVLCINSYRQLSRQVQIRSQDTPEGYRIS